jgi:cytochrome c-type biogenesis protein CcmF
VGFLELGFHYAVVLPYLGALLVALAFLADLAGRREALRLLRLGLVVLVLGWFVYMVPFVRLDYTLAEVARNSNDDLSLPLRIAASWSGGERSEGEA